jgi:hypothetical protein
VPTAAGRGGGGDRIRAGGRAAVEWITGLQLRLQGQTVAGGRLGQGFRPAAMDQIKGPGRGAADQVAMLRKSRKIQSKGGEITCVCWAGRRSEMQERRRIGLELGQGGGGWRWERHERVYEGVDGSGSASLWKQEHLQVIAKSQSGDLSHQKLWRSTIVW